MYQNSLKIKHNRRVYTSGLQANVRDRSGEKIKTYSGKHVTTKEALAAVGSPIYHTNLMADGSFLNFYISEQKFYAAADINGKKGPNQLGHDIFIFLVDKEKDILTATGKPYIYTDEELDEKDFEHEYQKQRAGNPCSINSTQLANGIGCAYYALRDECPDGRGRYFECLPK